jgi:hypothetical protein
LEQLIGAIVKLFEALEQLIGAVNWSKHIENFDKKVMLTE